MKVAVVGATGLVGTVMLKVLEERDFPVSELIPVASEKSVGREIEFKGKKYRVHSMKEAIGAKPQIALFSAGGNTSLEWAPKFAEAGTTVIDNSSAWRMDPSKKLVVPEINASELTKNDKVIANPNCSTIQMVVALNPLHQKTKINRIVVSTYQAVSGAGQKAINELKDQAIAIFNFKDIQTEKFPYQIAFNCLPHIDVFLADGSTKEEKKMVEETKKIMGDDSIQVSATCVRVPVFNGHAESINVEFEEDITPEEARKILKDAEGIVVLDETKNLGYPHQILASGQDQVFIGRIRRDVTIPHGLNLWVVADNLRKGAALNAIQIAEYLANNLL